MPVAQRAKALVFGEPFFNPILKNLQSPFAGTRYSARYNTNFILGLGDHRCRSLIIQQTVLRFPTTIFFKLDERPRPM